MVHHFILSNWGVPFEVTVVISVLFIWLYTFRSGIKTIVWTDTLQTFFMLAAVVATIFILIGHLDVSLTDLFRSENYKEYSKAIFYEDFNDRKHWLKSLFGGHDHCPGHDGAGSG